MKQIAPAPPILPHTYRLVIACPDRVGIVARVSSFIASLGGWLTEANYHSDAEQGWFFMRNEIRSDSLAISPDEFRGRFESLAREFDMEWEFVDASCRRRMVLLASHASHCLADLLHRWHAGDLLCDIPCVISNHENLREMVEWHGIPFLQVPITGTREERAAALVAMGGVLAEHSPDLVVLARYMQIIPPALCEQFRHRMINIHHSFLPSFVGANPYRKAFERGVKLIGATSHYVTANLDEGPIIEQDVIRVHHRHTVEDMVRLGKDVEKAVLARAVRNHLEDRVMVHGNKTVVFD